MREQHLLYLRAVEVPVVVAELERSLRAVVDHVVEVAVAPDRRVLQEESGGLEHPRAAVQGLAAQLESEETAGGARGRIAALGRVTKTPRHRGLAAHDDNHRAV